MRTLYALSAPLHIETGRLAPGPMKRAAKATKQEVRNIRLALPEVVLSMNAMRPQQSRALPE